MTKKKLITVFRIYRKPYPSGNWCPRYCAVYQGKELIEMRLNSANVSYFRKGRKKRLVKETGYADACNVIHDFREHRGYQWEDILDLGEVEVTPSEFKQYERMFRAAEVASV